MKRAAAERMNSTTSSGVSQNLALNGWFARLLREVRRLIEAEADHDHALGVAVMKELRDVASTTPKPP